ncbi:hypothetical protein NHH03_19500 [Stieleria sp. TO1_6]|uniref:hypothetical protein n=1 Tax=Stieleria tagensis TaxID=2956795 RepID=UPI00209B2E1C|nr:hypothetical protein [Stieleria tagensis]MCO8123939.1 hypothetical protein [Stieleria tagensis]
MTHPNPAGRPHGEDADLLRVEQQIAALGRSITPSSNHRDKVLRRASDASVRTRSKRRSAQIVVVMSLLLLVVSPLIGVLTRIEPPGPATAEQANQEALRHAAENRMSFDWALVDVFEKFRANRRPGR